MIIFHENHAYTRVRKIEEIEFDIHDRVNFAVKESRLEIEKGDYIKSTLKIDTNMCSVMDYFETFMNRMILCRKAADKLGLKFRLVINEQELI